MEKDYKAMLDRAYEEVPEQVESYERWTVPRSDVRIVGRRTVIMNFKEIADYFGRDPEHLLKFLSGEMATLPRFDATLRSSGRSASTSSSARPAGPGAPSARSETVGRSLRQDHPPGTGHPRGGLRR
jgi:hypothetical protein